VDSQVTTIPLGRVSTTDENRQGGCVPKRPTIAALSTAQSSLSMAVWRKSDRKTNHCMGTAARCSFNCARLIASPRVERFCRTQVKAGDSVESSSSSRKLPKPTPTRR